MDFRYTVREYCKGELFPEGVRMRPCSILFLDQVEKAHMSVFTALLSVLDRSMFIDHRGRTVGFRDTIVVISSDAGNKGIFSRLVGHASQNILDSDTKQVILTFCVCCEFSDSNRLPICLALPMACEDIVWKVTSTGMNCFWHKGLKQL